MRTRVPTFVRHFTLARNRIFLFFFDVQLFYFTQFLLMRVFDELLDNDYALSISLLDSFCVDVGKLSLLIHDRTNRRTHRLSLKGLLQGEEKHDLSFNLRIVKM